MHDTRRPVCKMDRSAALSGLFVFGFAHFLTSFLICKYSTGLSAGDRAKLDSHAVHAGLLTRKNACIPLLLAGRMHKLAGGLIVSILCARTKCEWQSL